jgi:hypothetical protein
VSVGSRQSDHLGLIVSVGLRQSEGEDGLHPRRRLASPPSDEPPSRRSRRANRAVPVARQSYRISRIARVTPWVRAA